MTTQIVRRASMAATQASGSLPADLMVDAVRRVGVICGLAVITAIIGAIARRLTTDLGYPVDTTYFVHADIGLIIFATASVSFYLYSKRPDINPQVFLRASLALEVFSCFMMGVQEQLVFDFGQPPPRPSLALAPILAFALMIPMRLPVRIATTIAALFATFLGNLAPALIGKPLPPIHLVAIGLLPTIVMSLLGVVGSRTLYRFAKKIQSVRRLGAYELVDKLGAGGMGEVWLARHRMLVRPSAIKLIKPEALESSGAVERFEREAQATASLRSPHTVELYDYGTSDDGTFYFVMELLDGMDLKRLIDDFGPVSPARAIHIMRQVCRSLSDAHASGMTHRDIKPANIFVCRMGQEHDFVKVLDFGLVKQTEAQGHPQLSQVNAIMGTPAFIAPEAGLGEETDARSDIYALGAVGFWLMTGRLLFEGSSPMITVLNHIQKEPPSLSAHSELDVPEALERLIADCLAKDPADRPQTAGELRQRLESIDTVAWTELAARAWWERHRPKTSNSASIPPRPSGLETTLVRDSAG